jgi:CspA family cold shock protein
MPLTGKVRKWHAEKGFGFIQRDDGKEDVFVHAYALNCRGFRSLTPGQAVQFDVEYDGGRDRAQNVCAPGGGQLPGGNDAAVAPLLNQNRIEGCFRCGKYGHFSRDCPTAPHPGRYPLPREFRDEPEKRDSDRRPDKIPDIQWEARRDRDDREDRRRGSDRDGRDRHSDRDERGSSSRGPRDDDRRDEERGSSSRAPRDRDDDRRDSRRDRYAPY